MFNHTFTKLAFILVNLIIFNNSYAASANCGEEGDCTPAIQASPQRVTSIADLSERLRLDKEQNLAVYQLVQKQFDEVINSKKKLEAAQSLLRNMAMHKQFDQTVVDMLAETIAKNSATLALLQAQREYEILSMLTPEQAQQYASLMQ